jgi:hypothetical protein
MSNRIILLGLTLAACCSSVAVQAQAWIGEMVGQMAAQQAAAQREQACIAGTPAPPDEVTKATEQSAALLDAYFDLSSKSKRKDIGRVFDLRRDGVSYKSIDGSVAVDELGVVLDGRSPCSNAELGRRRRGQTARGIWAVAAPGEAPSGYYAVDFSAKVTGLLKVDWRSGTCRYSPSLHPLPSAYCHYDPDQAW